MKTPSPSDHLRIARLTHVLAKAEYFWTKGAGFQVLWKSPPHEEGHALAALGWPDAAWHLELVEDSGLLRQHPPSREDQLVLYLGSPVDREYVQRLIACGGAVVAARNPYWDRFGITVLDPDGYRLVLCERSWG